MRAKLLNQFIRIEYITLFVSELSDIGKAKEYG